MPGALNPTTPFQPSSAGQVFSFESGAFAVPEQPNAATDLQQKYRQFLDLLPLTISFSRRDFRRARARLYSEEQIEARAITVKAALSGGAGDRGQGMPERVVSKVAGGARPPRGDCDPEALFVQRVRKPIRELAWRERPPCGGITHEDPGPWPRLQPATPSRKALFEMTMTTQPGGRTATSSSAAIIGFGLDGDGDSHPTRLSTGEECLLVGGLEPRPMPRCLRSVLRLESELDQRWALRLGEVSPSDELADIAWRIDSPELHAIALQLHANLEREGRTFEDSTAEQLTEMSTIAEN